MAGIEEYEGRGAAKELMAGAANEVIVGVGTATGVGTA
jgi:hypothetical protein